MESKIVLLLLGKLGFAPKFSSPSGENIIPKLSGSASDSKHIRRM